VRQPPGFAVAGKEDKVYCLRKALYNLRQAPHAWNAKLDATLKAIGSVLAGQRAHCPARRHLHR
jgi:hypothetical protein